ncbi:toll/interleukin-1 receptor domain-containing protein [Arthrobacter sp. MMS18-M83]|uniref:toll/interleukin-1 receptor domain-containing protein n=1 Tax=Arthrobacter sp. MMS18-M83 TaxID=2996261 RepID=UPI00227C0065|nr:toll/interleukin-1 receptor domain-containing protein [Arthrobacter sp. MMS18-M83]WAH97793.1 toll/interleukin-1 receptor domain-containing protein [Arthrobacter sp. MMS18-M83]
MKIFISWSGPKSKEIAKVLKWWIEKTSQTSTAFVSESDIKVGTRWSDRITNELAETKIGIICITPDNQNAPWINFEAGAISKAVDGVETKVAPILIDFAEKTDYSGPLREFHLCLLNKEGLLELANTINDSLLEPKTHSDVAETFDVWWERLDAKIQEVHEAKPAPTQPKRDVDEVVAEVLDIVRDIQKRGSAQPTLGRRVGSTLGKVATVGAAWLALMEAYNSDPSSVVQTYVNMYDPSATVTAADGQLVVTSSVELPGKAKEMASTVLTIPNSEYRDIVYKVTSGEGEQVHEP